MQHTFEPMSLKPILFLVKDLLFVSVIPFAYFRFKNSEAIESRNQTVRFGIFWALFFTLQYLFLGPGSYIHYYDEADTAIARYIYHNQFHIGGAFLHSVAGGADHFGEQLIGGQFFSLERFLLKFLPLWIFLALHKLMIVSVALSGTYLLLRKRFNLGRTESFSVAAFYSTFNPYSVWSTVHHGMGYSIIPLAVYVAVERAGKKNHFLATILLSILVSISTVPTHSGLALLFSMAIFAICFPPVARLKALLSILVVAATMAANWSFALYQMNLLKAYTPRVLTGSNTKSLYELFFGSLEYLWGKTDLTVFSLNFSPFVFLLIGTAIGLVGLKRVPERRSFWAVFLTIYSASVIYLMIYFVPQLRFLNSVNFYRIVYFLPIPLSVLIFTSFPKHFRLHLVFLSLAIVYQLSHKFDAFRELKIQNQKKITSIPNLLNRDWEPKAPFRVVTASSPYWGGFHPNFAWVYGLDSLDGYTNLISKWKVDFWYYGIHKKRALPNEPFEGGNLYITYGENNPYSSFDASDPSSRDLTQRIDINFLKFMNVGFVLSQTKLPELGVAVSEPSPETTGDDAFAKVRNKFTNLFHPSNLFVYPLPSAWSRAFFPRKWIQLQGNTIAENVGFISDNFCQECLYSKDFVDVTGHAKVLSVNKIPDGYWIEYQSEKDSLLILNQFFHPFWVVEVNQRLTRPAQVNLFQMGVTVSAGKGSAKFLYKAFGG